MSKRRAGTELTHDNWDQEEEDKEEAGVFKAADQGIIAKRAIKKAKRRGNGETTAGTSGSPFAAFQGFSGFSSTATTKQTEPSFGVANEKKGKVACTPAENTAPVISAFVTKATSATPKSSSLTSLNGGSSSANANMNSEYSKQLRSLNQSVSAWIQQHVNANPLCDLTPVFEDYKKHLGEIERKNSKTDSSACGKMSTAVLTPSTDAGTTASSTSSSAISGFSFTKSTTSAPSQSSFSFKQTPATGASSAITSDFSFTKRSITSEPTSGGAVSAVKPFSFGVGQPSSSAETGAAKTGDSKEDEPPKADFKQVEEKDALYSKRCKLFYKKDDTYKDRGVGMLHLKKTGDRGQILLRADTNLGNVILNVSVNPKMPATRQGKNNVLIMTAMNPPINEKCPKCNKKYPQPQESNRCESGCKPEVEPLLLRVKTGEDADQLLAEINKLKE